MNALTKILAAAGITVLVILGLSKVAIQNYRNAIIHSRASHAQAVADTTSRPTPASDGAPAVASTPFEGDLFAQIRKASVPRSTPAEDEQRARQAVAWVRVVFEEGSHPRFTELVK